MKARQESCDRVTPNIFRKDHRSLFLDPLYGDEEFGRDMAVTRETSSFDVGANGMLSPLIQEDQEVKYFRKANRHFYCWSRRLARAPFRSEQTLVFVNYQIQHQAHFMHYPAMTQMISIMEHI